MHNKTIQILSTRPVSDDIIAKANNNNILVDVLSFIDTEAYSDAAVLDRIAHVARQSCVAIFTSMNAADMVIENLEDKQPAWKIFCMGNTTKIHLEAHFGKKAIANIANDATQLAKKLVAWKYAAGDGSPVVFFCGDQRRDELPELLKQNKIDVEEITTYKTILQHHVINKMYDAVLFYSPSAVHSFFTSNQPDKATIYFAIGRTTANAIGQYSNDTIVTAELPSKDKLLEQAIEYFSNKKVN